MTGLFHRLARRVVGPELSLARTVARLPFASPPALEVLDTEPRVASPPAMKRNLADPDSPAANNRHETARRPETHAAPARLLPPAGPPAAASPGSAAPKASEPGETGPKPEPTAAGPSLASSVRHADLPGEPAARELADGPPAEVAVPEAAREGRPSAEARGNGLDPRDSASTAAPPAPRRLLPESKSPVSAEYPGAVPGAPARRRGSAESGPPEVHVHIGRIDVASVSEPQQQRREPPRRRGKPPMSLEDYLAKRKSGG
jgi:hypothetical protein